MSKLSEQIGLRLRAARRAANFRSARTFAFQNEIPESTYSQHETGKRALSPEMLLNYSQLLNVDPGWLLTGDGSPYLMQGQDQEREQLISQEMQNLRNFLDGSMYKIPPIKGRIALIDMELFLDVLRAIAVSFSNDKISVSYEDLIDFCIDIYNNVVTTSVNEKNRKSMINLSISSLKRGMRKNKDS